MLHRRLGLAALLALLALLAPGAAASAVDFEREVRPILADYCFPCHGPDEAARMGKLRLDNFEGATADRGGERAIAPGDVDASVAAYRMRHPDPKRRMPPARTKRAPSEAEIAAIERWIAAGAAYTPHWSFIAPADPAPPAVAAAGWPKDSLDRFVLARIEAAGLAPAAEADRATLLRRAALVLTGLPPDPGETADFLADAAPDAYERAVDRLLASPRFGEHLAAAWLDLARYSDTFGYQADVERRVWPWRDWVVAAFNENLPYDQFLTWQLAGDLLPEATREQRLATCFNRLHRQTNEGGSVEAEFRAEYVADRVNTFGTAFLGLTLECARCHDHKFDPIRQSEYYGLAAFFGSIDESGLYSHFTAAVPAPALDLPSPEQERALEEARAALAAAEAEQGAPIVPRRLAAYPLDRVGDSGALANSADAARPAQAFGSPPPHVLARAGGGALVLDGENGVACAGAGEFHHTDPFALALEVQLPDSERPIERAVILHRSRAWTDAGSQGYQLLVEDGRLSWSLVHFWPGDAIAIRTREPLPAGRFVHVVATSDGSGRAAGLALFIDGRAAACEVVRDHLTRGIAESGDLVLTLGQRFRDKGLAGGAVANLQVFDAPLDEAGAAACARGELPAACDDAAGRARAERVRAARRLVAERTAAVPQIMAMEELAAPRPAFVLVRGRYDQPGAPVAPGTPAALPPFPADLPRNRLGLARWLTAPGHPLTARVAVNRLWAAAFGRGLAPTVENLGTQGEAPSHRELLDHLACTFAASGFDVKALLRRIATSATFRQSSAARSEPDADALYARFAPRRLPAEVLRDQALLASGLLVERRGGPPVKPYQPPGLWEEKSGKTYVQDHGEALWRRSLYTFWRSTSPPPAMMLFDGAAREVCVARRQETSTPLQALALQNDPQYVETARALAARALAEAGRGDSERLAAAWRRLAGRAPEPAELDALLDLLDAARAEFRAAPERAALLLAVGEAPLPADLDAGAAAELAALAVACSAAANAAAVVTLR